MATATTKRRKRGLTTSQKISILVVILSGAFTLVNTIVDKTFAFLEAQQQAMLAKSAAPRLQSMQKLSAIQPDAKGVVNSIEQLSVTSPEDILDIITDLKQALEGV